eukprot:CAMPEP_0197035836 /NCGR_PEP_ID=MMETSP1384-20130603/13511_1 /TAXON_ID=29189 /ORGANISM="Ammonia sp." /LENGTH=217 /DNA_ID=CAMNT_0042465937 /DNA_START=59 /DNA_END=712 /DNA_ORIENTATION=+
MPIHARIPEAAVAERAVMPKRPTLRRMNANRPPSSFERAREDSNAAINRTLIKANVRMLASQFRDYDYLQHAPLVAKSYIKSASRAQTGLIVPDMVIALCVSYSFAPRDYALAQLSQFLANACKLWTAKKGYVSKKILFAMIAQFLNKTNCNKRLLTTNHVQETERYYNDLVEAELIVLVNSARSHDKVAYVAIYEESELKNGSVGRSSLNYYRFSA